MKDGDENRIFNWAFDNLDILSQFSEEAAEKIILIVRTVCRGNVPTEEATTPNPTEEPKFRFDEDKNESEEEFDLAENTPSNETVDYVGILECATRTAENISNEYDLLEDFELFNPQFALHLAALEKCSEGEDDAAIQACVELEAQAATKTFEKFLEVIREVSSSPSEWSRLKSVQFFLNNSLSLCRKTKQQQKHSLNSIRPSVLVKQHQVNQHRSNHQSMYCNCNIITNDDRTNVQWIVLNRELGASIQSF